LFSVDVLIVFFVSDLVQLIKRTYIGYFVYDKYFVLYRSTCQTSAVYRAIRVEQSPKIRSRQS